VELEADRADGVVIGFGDVCGALAELRTRGLATLSSLAADEWLRPSRRELWSVHDVVRHVRDVAKIHLAHLRGDASTFPTDEPFDGREGPLGWLRETAGETPAETMRDLDQLVPLELDALARRVQRGGNGIEDGPYGPVHWTVFTTHIFWDTWVHERDIAQPLGRGHRATAGEDSVAALYGLLVASIPAALINHSFETTVGLTAASHPRRVVELTPGRAVLKSASPQGEAELEGELLGVLDALVGRGPALETVLVGNPSRREPLTWLRAFMVPDP